MAQRAQSGSLSYGYTHSPVCGIGQAFSHSLHHCRREVRKHQHVLVGEPGLEGGRGGEPLEEVTDGGGVVGCENREG
jgi:hypothetical protein